MKKIAFLLLVTFMILSIVACGDATVDQAITQPETIEPSEAPVPNEEEVSPPPAAEETESPASAEGDTGETFSEPTFSYSVTWHGKEISVGMRFFEVLDLGFEYGFTDHRGVNGVDAETAQEIATRMVNPGLLGLSYYLLYGNYVLEVFLQNLYEEPRSNMETHIIKIRTARPQSGYSTGDIYYDGLLINYNTSFDDVQNRFGDGSVGTVENRLRYDYERNRGRGVGDGPRVVSFHFDENTGKFNFFIIENGVNPVLSDAVWDGELRLPRMR